MATDHHLEAGIARLTSLLPLGPRVGSLDRGPAAVHREVLASYLRTGAAPDPAGLALPGVDVAAALERLSGLDLVVVAGGRIVGAYPFRSDGTPHRVTVDAVETGAMCSLDALAIGAVTRRPTVVRSRCAGSGRSIRIAMEAGGVVAADPADPLVGIRWQEPGACAAASLCPEMVFLADAGVAGRWLDAGDEADAYPLDEAVTFAERFFRPVMSASLTARAGSRTGGSTAG